jgi:hypothetical protein
MPNSGAKRLILWLIYCCFNYTNLFRPLSEAIIRESNYPCELQAVAAIWWNVTVWLPWNANIPRQPRPDASNRQFMEQQHSLPFYTTRNPYITDVPHNVSVNDGPHIRQWSHKLLSKYRVIKIICEPDDYNTCLSCLTTWLNLAAWQPTARARGILDSH